jgi:hypothetical protein
MHRSCSLPALFVVMLTASCASGPKVIDDVDPFKTSRDEFHRTTKIVALAELYMPDGLPDPQPIKDNFKSLIETKLHSAGYTIVFPQQYKTIWKRQEEEAGGFVDSDTGERRHRDIARAMTRTFEELDAGFKLDAVIVPTIAVVEAQFAGGRAVWDGTSQSIKAGGLVKGFFAGSPDGTMGALSLQVVALTANGTPLYEEAGGIEVLSKLEGKDFVLVPRNELFTDQERLQKAVDIALDPLLR